MNTIWWRRVKDFFFSVNCSEDDGTFHTYRPFHIQDCGEGCLIEAWFMCENCGAIERFRPDKPYTVLNGGKK